MGSIWLNKYTIALVALFLLFALGGLDVIMTNPALIFIGIALLIMWRLLS